ncbi:MAG: hypothetical protein O7I93_03970 [Gemmatimonadetes bacterium]|nr:hypothetical protein [Gemmatimonadota bacterium]
MTSRREFLSTVVAAGAAAPFADGRNAAPRVEPSASIFFRHPAGETTLVRFAVHDADAPAGRLRVYDRSGQRLLGTAGVLGISGSLIGELWLPLQGRTHIITQLEMPGLAAPLFSEHQLDPKPRWTLYWITVVDPAKLSRQLAALPRWRRLAAQTMLPSLHVAGNPFPPGDVPPATLDHLPLLRRGRAARVLEETIGIPVSPVAVGQGADFRMRASILGMAAGDVSNAVLLDDTSPSPFGRLHGRDASSIDIASLVAGATPEDLGFRQGGDTMARQVEQWITETPRFLSPTYGTNVALIVGSEVNDDFAIITRAVRDWNSRYAFPRIVIGDAGEFFAEARRVFNITPIRPEAAQVRRVDPGDEEVVQARVRRNAERHDRVQQMLGPLNDLVGRNLTGIRGMAAHLDTAVEGTVVFNPSPVTRSDLVTMPDGSEHFATDIPAMGYAYMPGRSSLAGEPYEQPGPPSVFGRLLTVRLDEDTGAVSSLYHRSVNREWVRAGSPGLNAVRGAVLEKITRLRLPMIGMRIIAERRTASARLTTTITVYETLPWVDITNEFTDNSSQTLEYDFHFAADSPRVSWETPAGYEDGSPPLGPVAHLRWFHLQVQDNWQVLFRGLDAPHVSCDASGRVVSRSPTGRSRYRLGIASPSAPPDERWYFGWGTEPLVVAPVSGGVPGQRRLPRFGHLIAVDQPGIMVLGIKPADNGDGAIVYLQDVLGVGRDIVLRGGILGFRGARRTDVLERHTGVLPVTLESAVTVYVPAHGVATVRLYDLFLRGG